MNSDNQKVNVVFSHSFRDLKIEFAVLSETFFDYSIDHGRDRVTNFLRLGKENFVRAELSIQLLRLHSAARTLTSKRIAEEPTLHKIFFHIFNLFFSYFFHFYA